MSRILVCVVYAVGGNDTDCSLLPPPPYTHTLTILTPEVWYNYFKPNGVSIVSPISLTSSTRVDELCSFWFLEILIKSPAEIQAIRNVAGKRKKAWRRAQPDEIPNSFFWNNLLTFHHCTSRGCAVYLLCHFRIWVQDKNIGTDIHTKIQEKSERERKICNVQRERKIPKMAMLHCNIALKTLHQLCS